MNVTLENVAPCRKRLKVEVPVDRVNEELEKITQDFRKHAKIPGFRPGKTPKGIVEKKYAEEIEDELKRSFVPQAFREAVKSKKLKVVGAPQVEDLHFQRGMSLSFSAMVDLAPEFKLPNYKSFKTEKVETKEISEVDVDQLLERMTERFADYKAIEGRDEVREGDFVVMDYTATCGGKPLAEVAEGVPAELAERKNLWLWVKPDSFLPGFGAKLVGAKTGETREITAAFPDDFEPEGLRGKEALFSVHVRELKERILPELNDDFVKKHFQISAEELRKKIRDDLEAQQKREVESGYRKQIIDHLLKSVKFDLPEALVQRQTQRLVKNIVMENQHRGISEEVLEENKEKIFSSASENAKEHVKMSFILDRIAEEEKIEVTEQDLNIEIHVMAHRLGMQPQKLVKEAQKTGALYDMQEQILHRKTMDFLLKSCLENN